MDQAFEDLFSSAGASPATPKKVATTLRSSWGDERIDSFHWLRDLEDPATRAYLEEEESYYQRVISTLSPERETIFQEIKAKVKETDLSLPTPKGAFEYYGRTEEGRQYAIHCRRPKGSTDEVVLLDENVLAGDSNYLGLGGSTISPDHALLAYSVDFDGSEVYELRVVEAGAPDVILESIDGVHYGIVWSTDASTLFYTRTDEAMRPNRVFRHRLGTPPSEDVMLFQEDDERYFVGIGKTSDERYIVIGIESKLSSEEWYLDAAAPETQPTLFWRRRPEVEYSIDHHDTGWFVTTNDGRPDFRLLHLPEHLSNEADASTYSDFLHFTDSERLEGIDLFRTHMAVSTRSNGLLGVRIVDISTRVSKEISVGEELSSIWPGGNAEYDTSVFRFGYTSFVTPGSISELDITTGKVTLLRQQPVLGGYEPSLYRAYRVWATTSDGTRVPVSVIHHRDAVLPAPTLLYGYGAYEHSIDPGFSIARVSLLDRGVVFAIAHVRGGGEMGRAWYEGGRLLNKPNTFGDFIVSASSLISLGITSPGRLCARGGSAGGMLMGAVANLAPELFRAIIAEVPFVDCLTTMCDPELPLTVTEWEEWGNPVDSRASFDSMASYSPYDNVRQVKYPAFYISAGLNDPRVSYWEPAKWTARLRELNPGISVVLHTEMGSGHGGPSGRYDAWRDEATVLSFILSSVGSPPLLSLQHDGEA